VEEDGFGGGFSLISAGMLLIFHCIYEKFFMMDVDDLTHYDS